MRTALLVALLVVPSFAMLPTVHACWGPTPTASAGGFYFIQRSGSSGWIVEANNVALGIDVCSWSGVHTETWQETNGLEGLQTDGCTPDTLLAHTFVAAGRGVCRI